MKYDNIFNLKGKVAVVTGGCGVIARELVRSLAEFKASVILADIDRKTGKNIAEGLAGLNLDVIFRYTDITDGKSVSDLINFLDKKYGRIDAWINSAYPKTRNWGEKFENINWSSWEKNIDMHLKGYFISSQKAAEYMKRKRQGSIINFGSIYGVLAPDFSIYENTKMTMPAAYAIIKAGIVNFTKYLASYYGKYGIRINCISPGGIYAKQPESFVKKYVHKTLIKRMARPEDISGLVVYLVSGASEYVTGQNLIVDGGLSTS
ncbi:MAG: SDR family oxidoreductase [Candidatus Omnitrophica bacterium]|nr:SDR family oxidoreductase [Candidatus Omnitrophota bacterium]